MGTVHIDASEVARLAVDLSEAPGRLQRRAPRTMKRSALEIKRRMMQDFSGHRRARGTELSLEMQQLDGLGLTWEIGELDSAGYRWGLAAILTFGTSNNAPVVDHTAALWREMPTTISHLGGDAEDSVLRGAE
ncbi:hypothetical protein [Nocardioides aquiterrae]|uniref:DUF222 domain-containing protein n=1 Tax=Nocardioides aquiterrae TaxID=203799 RepID=A0ABN1UD06_9ACTN